MPIIINEFEIVSEPPAPDYQPPAGQRSADTPDRAAAHDPWIIVQVERQYRQRVRRLWAD